MISVACKQASIRDVERKKSIMRRNLECEQIESIEESKRRPSLRGRRTKGRGGGS